MAMTTEGALLPCQNPSCKSNGRSHPNCRCYPGLAKGGEVSYCQGPHKADCEYYAEGGEVGLPAPHQHGAAIIQKALGEGLYKGHHDLSDAILGHKDTHIPTAAITAHGGAPGLLKIASNSVFAPRVAQKPQITQERGKKFLTGVGAKQLAAMSELQDPKTRTAIEEGLGDAWFDKGMSFHGDIAHATSHPKEAGKPEIAEKLVGRDIHGPAKEFITPVSMHLLANGATPDEMEQGVSFAEHISKGVQKINKAVGRLFEDGPSESEPVDSRARAKLHKFVSEGTLHDQLSDEMHPEGEREITEGSEALAKHFPDHNQLLQAARARTVGYLNSIRPMATPGLPFDKPFASRLQERAYNGALDLANEPLSVLQKIKTGMIVPSDVQALQNMYPELYTYLAQQITNKISQAQYDKALVPPKVRRAMSVFLATPLDMTMTPASIQNVQAMFAKQRQNAQGGPPKSTAKLDKESQNAQTNSQALAARQQRPR